ncbi:MAG: hypothetical protein OXE40_13430 [Gammaproteobacteria bacterium]|nr:hypothetical protein [Gammaproteobacteria bacterium]
MPLNDFHIQIATAYPDARRIPSKREHVFLVEIQTDEGRKSAYVKLLNIEAIAKEALCAVLARKLFLPMLQPYYVGVDRMTIEGVVPANAFNIAFGVEADSLPAFKLTDNQMDQEVCLWPEALRLAAFDEWIFNRDRIPKNLVFAGVGHFWLIDHDEALPSYASPPASANNRLLQLLSHDKSEFELYDMRRRLQTHIEEYKSIDWIEILALLKPDVLPKSQQIFRRHIGFLQQRTDHLDEIFSQVLGIRQGDLDLGLSTSATKSKEK